jgi:hypothetical protein
LSAEVKNEFSGKILSHVQMKSYVGKIKPFRTV